MKSKEFVLGPIQRRWIAYMKRNPHKQTSGKLGFRDDLGAKMCCLGAGGIIVNSCYWLAGGELKEKGTKNGGVLQRSYKLLGLISEAGDTTDGETCLTHLNDDGHHTWMDIACMMEAAPELFFTKSV